MNVWKKRFLWFGSLVVSVLLLISVWVIWQNDRLAKQIRDGDFSINSIQALNSIPPLLTKPLRQMLYQQSVNATIEASLMIKVVDKYVDRRPLDVQGWLWKSLFHQRVGDLVAAKSSLAMAHNLSIKNTPMLLNVFNRYIELGLIDEAMLVAGDLSFAQPKRFRQVFYLMGRLSGDYHQVVSRVIPASVPKVRAGRKPIDAALYYRWALNDALRADNRLLIEAIWQATPTLLRQSSDFGLRYLEYLALGQQVERLSQVWLEFSGETLIRGEIPNQFFGTENTPCWKVLPLKNDVAKTFPFSNHGEEGLTVSFSGEENLNFYHASCLFIVAPEKQYVLKGRWKGDDITTLAGPFLDIHAPSVKGFYKKNDSMTGSWPWTNFEIKFDSQAGAEVMMVRLRRNKTSNLDSKIAGSVSIKDIRLVTIDSTSASIGAEDTLVDNDRIEATNRLNE